jgi:ATP-dependent Lon protease
VGGIKEKVLAAARAGVKTVLLPDKNRNDLDEVPAELRSTLEFVFFSDGWPLLQAALAPRQT